ncbi:phosphate transport system regulatory protein PhoU [Micromonospora sp. WMMD882]|uniref:phosphate signaling complex PhoU family protein n=1 Tax=Micromonospora sp. WMMD882 TaxID=3015151 RepID=UPI00248CAA32|nr:PhoU domain-containing protein [Micromonospora sp. WMMD882]WBB78976.1 phosphate transport system regulatory protein PhoU [Micromonospora sp. WMMD882]
MDNTYHLEQLDRLSGLLAAASRDAAGTIRRVSVALLDVDAAAARAVLAEVAQRRTAHREIDELVPVTLVRQQPVASDLRLVLAGLRMNTDLHRMDVLAAHIAKLVLARHPEQVVPPPVRPLVGAMAETTARIADKSALCLATRDRIDALQLGLDDDELDAQYERLFGALTDAWPHGVQAAIDVAMLGRYYERFADHAVNVARRVAYLVGGDMARGVL